MKNQTLLRQVLNIALLTATFASTFTSTLAFADLTEEDKEQVEVLVKSWVHDRLFLPESSKSEMAHGILSYMSPNGFLNDKDYEYVIGRIESTLRSTIDGRSEYNKSLPILKLPSEIHAKILKFLPHNKIPNTLANFASTCSTTSPLRQDANFLYSLENSKLIDRFEIRQADVKSAVQNLKSNDPQVFMEAFSTISRLSEEYSERSSINFSDFEGYPLVFNSLLMNLTSGNHHFKTFSTAIFELGRYRRDENPSIPKIFIESVHSENPVHRIDSISVIGRLALEEQQGPQIFHQYIRKYNEILTAALNDSDPYVRSEARYRLKQLEPNTKLTPEEASTKLQSDCEEAVANLQSDDKELLYHAIKTLSSDRTPETIRAFIDLAFNGKSKEFRRFGIIQIGKAGQKSLLPGIREEIISALEHILHYDSKLGHEAQGYLKKIRSTQWREEQQKSQQGEITEK